MVELASWVSCAVAGAGHSAAAIIRHRAGMVRRKDVLLNIGNILHLWKVIGRAFSSLGIELVAYLGLRPRLL